MNVLSNALRKPQRMGTGDDELSLLQKLAPIITGKPADYAKPDFYKGAGKALGFDVVGAPGDLGYLLGSAKGIQGSVADNWGEGRPLFEGVGESMGDPRDYGVTSDALAERAGMPFTDEQTRGRIWGDMIAPAGIIRALQRLRKMEANIPDAPAREPVLGDRFPSQRGAAGPVDSLDGEASLLDYEAPIVGESIVDFTGPTDLAASLRRLPRGRGRDLTDAKRKRKASEKELKTWRALSPKEQTALAQERGQKVGRAQMAIEGRAKQARKDVEALENMRGVESTIPGARRTAYPGIYEDPSVLASQAEAQVAPENPAMKELFGVTRDDLFEMNKTRVGPKSQLLKRPASGKVPQSDVTDAVMSPENTARLLENIDVAKREAPELVKGMLPWYVMDPAYQRLVALRGEEEATRMFNQMQALTGMSSPNAGVPTELARGLAANYLTEKGRFDDFVKYGGVSAGNRANMADFPADMMDVPGHMTHSTAHAQPMQKFFDAGGVVDMDSVKVPSYIEAAGVPGRPNIPFQTKTPVGDAHFARGIGLSDARPGGDYGKSITSPELRGIEDWWYNDIAQPSGMEGVPGQALNWGLYAPQTGVTTDIGAGKLELLSEHIMKRARKTGTDPETMRDLILTGKAFGIGGAGLLGAGALGDGFLYQPETKI